jgi:uncharacterized protein YdaU (DUF1376 family)
MAKDPAFLFYPGDWMGGTMLFSRHQKGCYIDLLMCQFQSGHMTLEDVVTILGYDDYEKHWESRLKAKFVQDSEGKYYNQKLEDEQNKRKRYTESRVKNKEGKNQYSQKKTGHMTKHMSSHMENEDEDENINTNNSRIPYHEIVNLYHEILPMLTKVAKLTNKRRSQIKARFYESDKTQDLDWWKTFFETVRDSNFLTGGNGRSWKPDLEWITKQENFIKICEGKYT